MFERRVVFGKKQVISGDLKEPVRPAPDADAAPPAFHKKQWDDPRIGSMLRDAGFAPDDTASIAPTADNRLAVFAAANQRLQQRTEAFNRDMTARHGHCDALPFLVIDQKIWDGPHGAFLYAQMNLVGYDEWNVIMLAGDPQTTEACGLAGHPGFVPSVTQVMTEHVIAWEARHSALLKTFGITASGGRQLPNEQYEMEKDTLRREIIDKAGWMKPRIIEDLLRKG
ncbi:hypothetical protein [Bradyrhizobium sp. CCBAU 53421]|uniref:hypothetical protein n=1 Tax=Bradyrhizobium sp. CCBAU 53421 TaxID=1325120 RepID=UPI00188DA218|nr:hypothetical protein [Bradyrhizobium sp. CCBAU 53421]QOZ34637.1 hypothetical protein XH92_25680 [Bradyrhizobium sp. CCBAU 53421]